MTLVKIDKKNWTDGLTAAADTYRLFGPVKEKDYHQFYVQGESKSMDVGMPFLVKGKSKRIGVLLSHGYMAAPLEVKGLADYLGGLGFWVYVPRLKGHGTSPDDLAKRSYMDWVESIDRGYALISSICRNVVVGGFSTGAGLALDLAARIERIAGVFAVAAPMTLMDFSSKFAPAVDMWNRIMDRAYKVGPKKEFVENTSIIVLASTNDCLEGCKGYVLYTLKPENQETSMIE